MKLYSTELERFPKERLNPLAASFAQAQQHVIADLGDAAATYISRSGGTYRGKIIGETALHTLQQVSSKSVIAHITERLKEQPEIGANITVAYLSGQSRAQVSVIARGRIADPAAQDQARALRDLPRDEALRQQPNLKGAYGLLDAALSAIPKANESTRQRVSDAMRERIAQYIERGTPLPVPAQEKKAPAQEQARKPDRGAKSPDRERER